MQAEFVINGDRKLGLANALQQYLLMVYPRPQKNGVLGLVAPPIELAVFEAKEAMEDTILRWMHRIISNQQQFSILLEQMPHPASGRLQLRIADKSAFQQLARQLKVVSQYICSYNCPEMQFTLQPHFSVQQKVADPAYHLLMAAQQGQHFYGSFEVRELVLLKKNFDYDSYKQVNVFALRP